MLNFYFSTMGPGSSPDPNIYYRTEIKKIPDAQASGIFTVQVKQVGAVSRNSPKICNIMLSYCAA